MFESVCLGVKVRVKARVRVRVRVRACVCVRVCQTVHVIKCVDGSCVRESRRENVYLKVTYREID